MTGPEHYETAEELLGYAKKNTSGSAVEHYHLAAAQVHATLALAAATVTGVQLAAIAEDLNSLDLNAWYEVSGTQADDGDDVPGVPR